MNPPTVTLANRTLEFSKNVIIFVRQEKITLVNKSMFEQLLRSATSVGANYTEANNAASKADFKNKIFIAKKEAAETEYWLTLLNDIVGDKENCQQLVQECHYILMTLQKIINTLKNGKQKIVNAR